MKRKTIATIVTGGILVLSLGFVSCGGSPTEADKASQANEVAKASESAATAAESKPSSNDESSSATSAPTPAPGTNYLAQGSADLTACADVHQFPLSNLQIGDGGREVPVVTGTVTNDTTESVSSIEVTALYVDNDTHMLGVATTHVSDLAPGTSQDFTIGADSLPIGCSLALVSDYDVMAVAPKR